MKIHKNYTKIHTKMAPYKSGNNNKVTSTQNR